MLQILTYSDDLYVKHDLLERVIVVRSQHFTYEDAHGVTYGEHLHAPSAAHHPGSQASAADQQCWPRVRCEVVAGIHGYDNQVTVTFRPIRRAA